MCAETNKVHFICVRATHHRRRVPGARLCTHLGSDAYCPAGDVGDHDWMPTVTHLAHLARLGYAPIDEGTGSLDPLRRRLDNDARAPVRT